MAVDGLKAVRMTENHIISIALALEVSETHAAAESSVNGIAGLQLEVDAFMLAAEARTIAVGRCYVAGTGHCELAYVDYLGVGHGHTCVGVDALAFPALGIDVEFGLGLLLEKVVEESLCILA